MLATFIESVPAGGRKPRQIFVVDDFVCESAAMQLRTMAIEMQRVMQERIDAGISAARSEAAAELAALRAEVNALRLPRDIIILRQASTVVETTIVFKAFELARVRTSMPCAISQASAR